MRKTHGGAINTKRWAIVVKTFRSDRGTNFNGATSEHDPQAANVKNGPINKHLNETGAVWIFNSPHSSQMGGSWERMIGLIRSFKFKTFGTYFL
jgi:hypothetical protein